MSVAVVSSVYGDYDEIKPPPEQDTETEWVLVTGTPMDCPPWRVVVEPRPHLTPRMASKLARARPDLYTDADITIWVDGNLSFEPGFVSWVLANLGGAPMLACEWNASLRYEAKYALTMGKYGAQRLIEQAGHYIAAGLPDDVGTWWAGLIARTRDCPQFGDAWLREMVRWGTEDQLSLSWVLWQARLYPVSPPVGTRGSYLPLPGWPLSRKPHPDHY